MSGGRFILDVREVRVMWHFVRVNENHRRFREFRFGDKRFQFLVNGIGIGFGPPRRNISDRNVVQGGCDDADTDPRLHVRGYELE